MLSHAKNANNANTAKQNYPGSVAYYEIRSVMETDLNHNAPEPTLGQ